MGDEKHTSRIPGLNGLDTTSTELHGTSRHGEHQRDWTGDRAGDTASTQATTGEDDEASGVKCKGETEPAGTRRRDSGGN